MSKKTNAEKRDAAKRKHVRKRPRSGKRPNPAKFSLLSAPAMASAIEEMMWGQFGCAILRACGIKPIELAISIQSRAEREEGLAGTVNSDSPDAQEKGKAEE